MRTLLVGITSSLVALVGFATTANATATIDLLWGGTSATLTTTSGASSTNLVLHVVLTNGALASAGASVNIDYSSATGGELTYVTHQNTTFTPPLPLQVGLTTDNGTVVTNVNAVSTPPNALAPGATFLLGTVTFHKGAGAGTFSLDSTGSVADILGGVYPSPTFNSAVLNSAAVPEPGTMSLLFLGVGGLALAGRRRTR